MIRVKMSELESDLNHITSSLAAKKPSSASAYSEQPGSKSTSSSTMGSQASLFSQQPDNYHQSKLDDAMRDATTKRSVSSLVHTSRSTTTTTSTSQNPAISKLIASEVQTNSPLYSKSTSSIGPTTVTYETGHHYHYSPSTSNNKDSAAAAAAASSSTNTSLTLTSGYKYTPLRQSWSNLSQMNALSPTVQYSPSVHNNSTTGNNYSATTSAHLDNIRYISD
jgi:hypothetical protein